MDASRKVFTLTSAELHILCWDQHGHGDSLRDSNALSNRMRLSSTRRASQFSHGFAKSHKVRQRASALSGGRSRCGRFQFAPGAPTPGPLRTSDLVSAAPSCGMFLQLCRKLQESSQPYRCFNALCRLALLSSPRRTCAVGCWQIL